MEEIEVKNKNFVIAFLIITLGLSGICYYLRIVGGKKVAGMTSILMWCLAIAAFVVKRIFYHRKKLFGWNKCDAKYIVIGMVVPIIYIGLSYMIYWMINGASFTGEMYTNSIAMLLCYVIASFDFGLYY